VHDSGDVPPPSEPGQVQRGVEDQIRILETAIEAGARAVDVEIESAELANARLDALRRKAKLIVSYHNFENTPVSIRSSSA